MSDNLTPQAPSEDNAPADVSVKFTQAQVHDYLLSLPGTTLEFPFGEEVAVYKVDVSTHKQSPNAGSDPEHKMFALIAEGSDPVRLSLKCDPELAVVLRDKYESIMPGYHLNKKHWNTLILSGQLTQQEVFDLILHSYNLVTGI